MNRARRFRVWIVVFCVTIAVGSFGRHGGAGAQDNPLSVNGAVSTAFTYQGELKRGGKPATSSCDFRFSLWNAVSGGGQVGGTQTISSLAVADGHFSALLNDTGQFGADAFAGQARWLQIGVRCPAGAGAYDTLSPRQPVTAVPYALYALNAGRADLPCFDNSNRYVDCGNGTVTDTMTGLLWLKNANCYPMLSYAAANTAAAGLKDGDCGLTDNSSPGDWRLPTKAEWEATVAQAKVLGCVDPSLTNALGTGCYSGEPFTNIALEYWSRTSDAVYPTDAWLVTLYDGNAAHGFKTYSHYVWPVRGGQ